MSTNYTAYAIVGMRIEKEKLYDKVAVRCCNESIDTPAPKFCPHCGKRPFHIEKVPVKGYDPDNGRLLGYVVIDPSYGYDGDVVYVGNKANIASCSETSISGGQLMIKDIPPEKTSQVMRKRLGKLWKAEDFGIWAVLQVS